MKSELKKLKTLIARNTKLYFKDKMIFFVSLITPLILVVLFITFLKGIYEENLIACLPEGISFGSGVVNAFTGAWLFSSIVSVSCMTVAFCSNMMVTDKVSKTAIDFQISPVKRVTVQTGYTLSNTLTTALVCTVLLLISFIYLACVGWFLSFMDVVLIFLDMILSILFGSLLASIVGFFVSSQGAWSAVCSLITSMYGFISGAYMPISSFGSGMQNFVTVLPGTYSTVLFRKLYMRGVLEEMGKVLPSEAVAEISRGFDVNFSFFGHEIGTGAMFVVVIASVLVVFALYAILASVKIKAKHKSTPQMLSEKK